MQCLLILHILFRYNNQIENIGKNKSVLIHMFHDMFELADLKIPFFTHHCITVFQDRVSGDMHFYYRLCYATRSLSSDF